MLVSEIVNSCSNEKVAGAALASIGGAFAARVVAFAESEGVEAGRMAAALVRRFAQNAVAVDWQVLRLAIAGTDQPVLAGLRHILEAGMSDADAADGLGPAQTAVLHRPIVAGRSNSGARYAHAVF